ncbi:hypothetical protein CBR_g76372 [Chara braunii]|uniref:CCHC-type domain-containing protein n=1 Tax=Chara braunii TaxID=69332 RepID=A0A388JK89_CHABU|nr:hypothetical protein CBR_g76244 [Chara braunii]GBG42847.1 hypothetical protein CBR_g76372 [Chara braunii]|eukprot:GBG42775.1 hypothetical protein CBR_g76244 [Chara braunii]
MAEGGHFPSFEWLCYTCRQPGHFARNCPYAQRQDGLISGTPVGRFGPRPSSYSSPLAIYAPSAPPISQAPVLQQLVAAPSASPLPPSLSSVVVPYRPPVPNSSSLPSASQAAPWVPRPRSNDGEVVSLLRELVNDRREEKDRRREAEDRLLGEEQSRLAKEEERRKQEEEEARQVEKEACMARIINAKMEELDTQHQTCTEEENRKIWKEIEKAIGEPRRGRNGKEPAVEDGDTRKRPQGDMGGSPPILLAQGRPRCDDPPLVIPNLSPLDAGLLLMEIDNVKRTQDKQVNLVKRCMEVLEKIETKFSTNHPSQQPSVAANAARRGSASVSPARREVTEEPLGFDRINPGKKAAVASSGKEGRIKYIEDLRKELMSKSKYQLESLCKADKIKYYNKLQASTDLAEMRARDAYGELPEEEGLDNIANDIHEDNPS